MNRVILSSMLLHNYIIDRRQMEKGDVEDYLDQEYADNISTANFLPALPCTVRVGSVPFGSVRFSLVRFGLVPFRCCCFVSSFCGFVSFRFVSFRFLVLFLAF